MLASVSLAAAHPVPARDAALHTGERVEVFGLVAEVRRLRRGSVAIDLDTRYPREAFTLYVPRDDVENFEDLRRFRHKIIAVLGVVKIYKGRPEIVLEFPDQIVSPPK